MGRIPALTSIRFVAALLVFVHHYLCLGGYRHFGAEDFMDMFNYWDTNLLVVLIYEMRFGVTLFFVLSGFLLAARYFDTIFTKVSFKEYWIKRLARIFPLYWGLCLILLGYYAYKQFFQGVEMPFHRFPVYLSLTQGFFSGLKFSGLETAWSLTVEESFYLLLPIVIIAFRWAWIVDWNKLPSRRGFGWMQRFHQSNVYTSVSAYFPWKTNWVEVARYTTMGAVLGIITWVLYLIGKDLVGTDFSGLARTTGMNKLWTSTDGVDYLTHYGLFERGHHSSVRTADMRMFTIFGRFFDFAIGIAFGMIYLKTRNRLLKRGWIADTAIALAAVGIIITCIVMGRKGGMERMDGFYLNWVNAVFSGIILYFLCAPRSWTSYFLSWRPFVYLGEISFALYLVHKNEMVNSFYWWLKANDVSILLSVVGLYVLFTLLSVLAYEVIERPSQHVILSRYFGALKSRRPTVLRLLTGKRRDVHAAA